ncbi:MAG TPA: hypothetical protein VGC42_26805 [Kofleriaceae bacterium]
MHRRWLPLLIALFTCVVPRLAAANPSRLKVAVVPSISVNLDAARVDALSQDLAEALRAELDIDTVGGLDVRRLLPPAGLPADCVANQACINDVAKRLGAQQLLFVVMIDTGSGGAIQVDSTWVDATTHQSSPRPAIDIAAIASAKQRFVAAAPQLLPDAPVRPKPKQSIGRMSPAIPRHFTVPSYITGGATIAGVAVGVFVGLSARSKYKDCERQAAADMACSDGRKSSIRTTDLIADAGWLVAIGGAVATAVLFATSAESSHLIVEPTANGVALTAIGTF